MILYPSGKIVYQYLSMVGTLNSATVGIQDATRLDGLNVVYNAAYLHDNMAIEFKSQPQWISTAPNSGTIPAGTCAPITATFDATNPDLTHGIHDATIHFTSNDPGASVRRRSGHAHREPVAHRRGGRAADARVHGQSRAPPRR